MVMKNDNFFIYIIPINIIAFVVLLISIGNKTWNSGRQPQSLKSFGQDSDINSSVSKDKVSLDKYIDRELYYTELKTQLEKDKLKDISLNEKIKDINKNSSIATVEEKRFGFFEDKKQITAEEDTRKQNKKRYEAFTVGYRIQAELADQKAFSEYSEEYKQAFVEEFIRRAEADGYMVEVSEDYIVTSVRAIRKPQSEIEKSKINYKNKVDLNNFAN